MPFQLLTAQINLSATSGKLCNGQADGFIDLVVSGGTAPFSFLWSNASITEDLTGLTAGTFSVHVEDASATPLSADLSVTLVDPSLLSVDVVPDPILCFGEESRNSYANASGGTPPYAYLWSSGYNPDQNPVNGLLAGSHSVLVTDNNGCVVNTPFSISQPTALSISVSSPLNSWGFNVTCGERDGIIEGVSNGGTVPYSFSCFGSVSGGSWISNNPYFNNLGDEEFEVKVIDANLCTAVSFMILTTDNPCPGKYWYTIGNAGINPANNFLGTTDTSSLVFRTNNSENARIINNGNVGIGVSLPVKALHVFTTHEMGFEAGPKEAYTEATFRPTQTTTSIDEAIKIKYQSEFLTPPSPSELGHEMDIFGPPVSPGYTPVAHFPTVGLTNGIRQGIRLENVVTNLGGTFCPSCPSSVNSVWDLEPLVSNKGNMFGITAVGAATQKQILTLMASEKVGINTTDPYSSLSVNKDQSINIGSYLGPNSLIAGEFIGFNTVLTKDITNSLQLVKLKTGNGGGGKQRGGAIISADYYGNLNFQMFDPDILTGGIGAGAHAINSALTGFLPQVTFSSTGNVGIGTLTPAVKLSVVGNTSIANGLLKLSPGPDQLWTTHGWNVALEIGQGDMMRMASPSIAVTGKYFGYGVTDAGWYWMTASDASATAEPKYPMQLTFDACGLPLLTVQNQAWCDFVFDDSYCPMELESVEKFVKENKHLPDIPTQVELERDGLTLNEMQRLQMQKIEEIFLYLFELKKENEILKLKMEKFEQK